MSLRANVVANVSGQVAAAAIALLLAPWFVQRLGLEAWGLVGLLVVVSAWFNLIDVGFTQSITREIARVTVDETAPQEAGDLVRCIEWIYLPAMLLVALAMALAAGPLASGWLRLQAPLDAVAGQAIALMGVIVGARLYENIYRAVLSGLQQMVVLNVLSIGFALLRWLGAMLWVVASDRGVVALFEWQTGVALFSLACFGMLARSRLRSVCREPRARWPALLRVRGFAAGIAGSSLLAFALTQADKLLLSRLLSLAELGTYMLAAALADTLAMLAGPLYSALVPRFAQLSAARNTEALAGLYQRATQWLAAVLMPCTALLVLHAEPIARLWTGSDELAAQIAPLVALLAAGRMLNAVMHVPAALQVGSGWTSLASRLNLFAVVLLVPLILWSVPRWGAPAAAACWLVLNVGYLILGTLWMHRQLLPEEKARWVLVGLVLPAALSTVWIGLWSYVPMGDGRTLQAGALALLLGSAIVLLALALPAPRALVLAWRASRRS